MKNGTIQKTLRKKGGLFEYPKMAKTQKTEKIKRG